MKSDVTLVAQSTESSSSTGTGPRRGMWALLIAGVVGIALIQAALALSPSDRELFDTDGYMRALRVEELLSGQVGWFESVAPRSNAPFGHSMHWTRPLDLLVSAIAVPLWLVLPLGDAVYWAALGQGVVVLASLALAVEWMARPLVGPRVSFLAGLGVVLQPSLISYSSIGRADHHALLFLCFSLLVGAMVRAWERSASGRIEVIGGVIAGVGLWVSTEFLLPVALVLLYGGVLWIVRGGDAGRIAVRFSAAWAATTAIAFVLERGPGLWAVSYDRISLVHVVVSGLVAAAWWVVEMWYGREESTARRGVAVVVTGAVAGLVVLLLFPPFFGGPFVEVPLALREAWLSRVAELLPLWPVGDGVATGVFVMGSPAGALVLAAFILARPGNRRLEQGWPFVVGSLGVMASLGFLQLRFSPYAQILGTLAWAWLGGVLLSRIPRRSLYSSAARVGAMALAISGFLGPAMVASAVETFPTLSEEEITAGKCSVGPIAGAVDRFARESDSRAPIVLANVDFGPELMYRSSARVLAAPYHRNVDGILDVRRALLSTPDVARAEVVEPRGVDLVVVCQRRDRGDLGSAADDPSTLFSALTEGAQPSWLTEIPLEGESVAGVRMFAVTG